MLPVYSPTKGQPPVEDAPVEAPVDDMPPDDLPINDEPMGEDIHKLNPAVVVYKGPESGPFSCSNCLHFLDEGACAIVSGPIDPEGLCNVFESAHEPAQGGDEEMMSEEMPTEETPIEPEMPVEDESA
jgi:hypothetical protein